MLIWIMVLGEPIVLDEGTPRLHRAGLLAKRLLARGHEVVFWTSNQDHFKKKIRCIKTTETQIDANFTIIQLAGRLYKKNISLSRIRHNLDVVKEFKKCVDQHKRPDVVMCAYPTIELTHAVISYCNKLGIPSIVDIRDFWPDIFYEVLPDKLKFLGRLLFYPWERLLKKIINNVSGVTGISDQAIAWARSKNNQLVQNADMAFPLAYERNNDNNINYQFLSDNNLDQKTQAIFCLIGNLSATIDVGLKTIALAAKKLHEQGCLSIRLVICGTGDMFPFLQKVSLSCPILVTPGRIDANEIKTLLKVSTAGLLPYPSSHGLERAYPNKVAEYMSQNLPVISSIKGAMSELIDQWRCGITYEYDSVASLVNALLMIKDKKEVRQSLSEQAKKCFLSKFDADFVYESYTNFIEQHAALSTSNTELASAADG